LAHRFWLIRHALVDAKALAYLYGINDVPLCDTALVADSERYEELAARLPRQARLICTPLSRTQLTAAAIMRAGYPEQRPVIDAAFVEQNFGAYQGMPIAGFDSRLAGERHPYWPIHEGETPPGGESFGDMIRRVGAGLDRLAADETETNFVVVSHGGAIRAACAHALGLSPHQALCLAVDNLSVTRLEHNKHGWRVLSINEHISTLACETTGSASITDARLDPEQ